MSRFTHSVLTLTCAVILTTVYGCSTYNNWQDIKKEVGSTTVQHVPDSGLKVETNNGHITVRKSNHSEIKLKYEVRAIKQVRLEATEVITQRNNDGTLEIYVKWPDGKRLNNEGCSIDLTIPNATDVVLRTSNGKLVLEGVGNEADLKTSNGSIVVKDLEGPVIAKTSNGKIKLTRIGGEVDAKTSNASVTLNKIDGPIVVKTSNGSIHTSHIQGTIKADTSNATIAAGHVAGPFSLGTSNGSIKIKLDPTFAGAVKLDTSNGKIDTSAVKHAKVSGNKHHKILVVGNSELKCAASTSNSSIRIETH